jgi:DNA-binding GntR family transcriptional regulator
MTTDFEMNMDAYLPLRDVVFNTLRQAILYGKLKPGERLMEITLANRLGVSRTPVREAIRKLELEGLVIMIPRKGAQVAPITEQDLNDVLEVRLALEELAMSAACKRITQGEMEEIGKALRAFEECMDSQDVSKLAQADEDFHERIYQATGNRRLIQIIHNLREQIYRYRVEYLKDWKVRSELEEEHRELFHALQEGDVPQAVDCMKRHIQNQQYGIVKTLKSGE